jgi:hypothetical protein
MGFLNTVSKVTILQELDLSFTSVCLLLRLFLCGSGWPQTSEPCVTAL